MGACKGAGFGTLAVPAGNPADRKAPVTDHIPKNGKEYNYEHSKEHCRFHAAWYGLAS